MFFAAASKGASPMKEEFYNFLRVAPEVLIEIVKFVFAFAGITIWLALVAASAILSFYPMNPFLAAPGALIYLACGSVLAMHFAFLIGIGLTLGQRVSGAVRSRTGPRQ
jgi:hypothetical protein